MRVAIPAFGDRVSPRFDCANTLLIVTLEHREIIQREELSVADWAPQNRIKRLVDLGVDSVICGGIDRWSANSLANVGISLHGWVSGSIEESLAALQHGQWQVDVRVVSEARCGCGQGQRRGHRRGGGHQELPG